MFHEFRECIFQGSSSLEERNDGRDLGFVVVDEFRVLDEPLKMLTSKEERWMEGATNEIERGMRSKGWETIHSRWKELKFDTIRRTLKMCDSKFNLSSGLTDLVMYIFMLSMELPILQR